MVLMSIGAFEKKEQMLQLRAKVLQAERERMSGAKTLSISNARQRLMERLNNIYDRNISNCFEGEQVY